MKATPWQRLKKHREYKARERRLQQAQENLVEALKPYSPMKQETILKRFIVHDLPQFHAHLVKNKGKGVWA